MPAVPAAPVEASGDRAVRAGRAVWAVTPEAVTVIEVVKGDVDEVVLIGGGCGSLEASGHGKVWVPKVTPWDAWEPWDPRLLLLGSLRFRVMAAFTAEPAEAIMEAWWAGGGQMGSWMESTALAAEMEPTVDLCTGSASSLPLLLLVSSSIVAAAVGCCSAGVG